MNPLFEIASDVNLAAMEGVKEEIAKELPQRIKKLIAFFQNDPLAMVSVDGHNGFHLGQAFDVSFYSYEDKNSTDAKFAFYCSVIGYCKAIELGTMQSAMAAQKLYQLLENNHQLSDVMLLGMTNEYMVERFNIPREFFSPNVDTKKVIEWRFARLNYYLAQITRLQDAFKDANITACKIGNLYLQALLNEAKERIEGYMYLGIV